MQALQRSLFFLVLLGVCLFLPLPGWTYAFQDSYIPPEVAYAQDLSQTVRLHEQFNVNLMNLDELKSIPGLSEDIALKIMRSRPFADIQDFRRRMPNVSGKQLNQWIRQIQPQLQFK